MIKYVINRLLFLIPTILIIIFIVFGIMDMTPGTPGRQILGVQADQAAVDMLNEELGYNRPFFVRLGDYILGVVQGDFGESYLTGESVMEEIFSRFPVTLTIAILGIIGTAAIGIPLGVLSAVKQYSFADTFSTALALFFASIPFFWLGMMLILFFGLKLDWLPASGIGTWQHYVLPTIAVSLPGAGGILRMTRTTMVETIRQDYIRTARAKGSTEKRVIWGHALKNAMLPVFTNIGLRFGSMLGGTVVLEAVFGMPGLGTLVVNAIRSKDIPQVMGTLIFLAVLFCLIMLVVDIVYAFIDPRIKAKYTK